MAIWLGNTALEEPCSERLWGADRRMSREVKKTFFYQDSIFKQGVTTLFDWYGVIAMVDISEACCITFVGEWDTGRQSKFNLPVWDVTPNMRLFVDCPYSAAAAATNTLCNM